MELIEKKYRDTPQSCKKYTKRLTDYINQLFKKGRLLEAKYFFEKLYELKPNQIRTIKIGYSLSIALFDSAGVQEFDKKLCKLTNNENEITWYRLKFYHSVNDKKNIEECSFYLLSKDIKPESEYINTIIEVCVNQRNYDIAAALTRYAKEKNLSFNSRLQIVFKKILIQQVANCIIKVKNG